MIKKILPLGIFILIVLFFFKSFFLQAVLPIPSDTIVGLYHPFRDFYAKDFPNGIPFKNFLITDPVRQQYPWRELAISLEKNLEHPSWNPYSGAGTVLLANFQSAPFYPLNFLFFSFPFQIGWSLLIILQPILGGIFLYLYLRNLKLDKLSSIFGAIVFAFSGFSIAWMEWGTVLHTALWLPLILLSFDKIFEPFLPSKISNFKNQKVNLQIKNKKLLIWCGVLIFSLTSSFFAGHLQVFFYLFLLSIIYFFARFLQFGRRISVFLIFAICYLLFAILSSIQWFPTFQFILLSARNIDQSLWQQPGWFIPWQNLIQFLAPDFFGNPATLNYWGVWNYGEFIGYVGIVPFVTAIFAMFFRHDKKTLFFGSTFFVSLIFALPTFFAKLPFLLNIPFVSTAQPTRLLFVTDFSLAILAALGFDYFIKRRKKEIIYPMIFICFVFAVLWIFSIFGSNFMKSLSAENLSVAKNNLIFPSAIFTLFVLLLLILVFSKLRKTTILYVIIIAITVFDLFRFGFKFEPFTQKEYLFPQTQTISFLQKNSGNYRIMAVDSRIFPPNFSTVYKLQSIDIYDPLYLMSYGELIAASERGKPDISSPFGFNRIITPHNFESKIIDLLGVKYVLSLSEIKSEKLNKVFQEGQTIIYENINVLPRAFFVKRIIQSNSKTETITKIFDKDFNEGDTAIIEESRGVNLNPPLGCLNCEVEIEHYSENKIVINTKNNIDGFLILTDSFYPTWHVKIDGAETKIYKTDYNFRGIFISRGRHRVLFYSSLF